MWRQSLGMLVRVGNVCKFYDYFAIFAGCGGNGRYSGYCSEAGGFRNVSLFSPIFERGWFLRLTLIERSLGISAKGF